MEFYIELMYNLDIWDGGLYMGEKRMNKGFMFFLILFVLIILVFAKEENQQKLTALINNISNKEIVLELDKEYSEDNLIYFNDSILKWDKGTLAYLDEEGNIKFYKEYGFDEPEMLLGEKYIYVFDKSLGDIYIMDAKGDTISSFNLNKRIFNIKEYGDNILVHYKGEDEGVEIIDMDGKQVLPSMKDKNILTYALNNSNKSYGYSSINQDKSAIKSKFNLYNSKGDLEYSIDIKDKPIVYSEFMSNDVLIMTDSDLNYISKGEIKWSREFPLIKDLIIYNNRIYLLYGDNLEIIDHNGETDKKITFGLEYEKIFVIDKTYICLYGNKDILILQNGEEIIKYMGKDHIEKISGDIQNLAINYKNEMDIFKVAVKDS